jgi:hypothetical protein
MIKKFGVVADGSNGGPGLQQYENVRRRRCGIQNASVNIPSHNKLPP